VPATIHLDLDVTTAPTVYPARIHGAACAMLGHPAPAGVPDFSAWPLVGHGDRARWRLGWLPSSACPGIPTEIAFGERRHRVVEQTVVPVEFAELAACPPARHADIDVHSPMYFSRNGRDLPLPDPVQMLRSPMDRWDRHAPPELRIPAEVRRELLSTVYVVTFDGGTRRGSVGRRTEQTGFTGSVTLALTRTADRTAAHVFGAVLRFASIAGIGAQTAHGFGAVTPRLHDLRTDQLRDAPAAAGPRKPVVAGQRR
jgi:CRISPR-associated endoribonuclease Cas6